ncbi:Insulin-like growth factor binding protein, N-terminal [Pseudocohnilembus persalinus]|uniref:Insulin-like growth factor binding protein, N-terminal n=1 Tax=Pseudocohnilembus persalinus TaxID=266149 RepID=A0A0V0R5Q8_PSEPJ|nr:Insulin-like growth factor binding protein, N-terminal [Pseudocohnilembus persalinus]|eukprot:KRX09690.1 Insulin-like growth factor binding protein, N-terminal [Pseudocohnilembus persalinus]
MIQSKRSKTPLFNTRYEKTKATFKTEYDDFKKNSESPERQRPSNDKRPKDLFNATLQNYANSKPQFKIRKQQNVPKDSWNFDATKESFQNTNQKYRSLSTQKFLPKISQSQNSGHKINLDMFSSLKQSLGQGKIKLKKKKKLKKKNDQFGDYQSQQYINLNKIQANYDQQQVFQVKQEYNTYLAKGSPQQTNFDFNNNKNNNNINNNININSGGKNFQKGRQFEFEETKYDDSGTYKIKKPMDMGKLEDFLLNRQSQQEKDKFLYNEILNTAKYLGLNSLDEMIFFKDLLLYALQGNIQIDGDFYYNIRYWLSNQFRFLNASTMEKYKLHPQIEQIKSEITEKKKDILQKLNPVTENDVIQYIKKKQGDKNIDINDEQFMQCEKAVRDLQLLSKIAVLQSYKDIILEMTRPPKRWEIFYDDLRKKIIFVNQDDESERFLNPSHNEISHKAQNSDKHIEIEPITEQDIKIYYNYDKENKISKEKREYIDKIFGWMQVTENIYKAHKKYILDELQHFQTHYFGIKFIKDNIIQVQHKNSGRIKLEQRSQQKPNELKNVNNLFKYLNRLDPQDVDYYMINNLKIDLYKKQIIDKVFADLEIRNEEEKKQNIGLVKSILENCQNKFEIIQYIISTKIAFLNKETREIKQTIPALPKADKFIEIQAPKKQELQMYLDKKHKLGNKQQVALVDKCLSDLGLSMDSFGSLIDYTTIVYQMMTNPVFKAGKDGYKSKNIVFKDINQGRIYKEYPDLPKNDYQIFNIIGQISEADIRNFTKKTLRNIDKKDQIRKYYLKLDIDPNQPLSEQDENLLIKYIKESNPKWTLVKFPKLRKIKLMDEMTGETQEYPETFPLGNKILARKNNFDKMYTELENLNIYDVKNYVERIQIPLPKKEQLDKYCRALNLTTDEEKKLFIKQLQQIVDKKLPVSWVYCRNNQNKKKVFVQRDSNPFKEVEFPPGFPNPAEVMQWQGELPLFTKEDIEKFISGDFIKSEKFEQLGEFIKELGIDKENLPSSKNQLEKYLVVDPDSGWVRYYSLKDKKKYFFNKQKGLVQPYPPNYPSEKEKKELHYKIAYITEAEINDFLNNKRKDISQDKVDELVNICQELGFTNENQKKEGRQVLLRIYNFDQEEIERVKFQQGGEIMYKKQNVASSNDPKSVKKKRESYSFQQYPVKIDKDFLSRQLYIDVEPITREDLETFLSLKPLFDQGKQQQLEQFCINNGFQVDKNNHENAEIVKKGIFKAFTDTQHVWKRIKDIKSGEYKYMSKTDSNKIQDCPCLVDQKDFRQLSDNIKLEEIDKFVNTLTIPDKIKQQELRRLQKTLKLKDHNKLKKYKEFFKTRVFDSKNEWDRYLMPKQKEKKIQKGDTSPISQDEQPALDVVYINRKNPQKQRFLSPMFDNIDDQYNKFQKVENQNYEEQIIKYLKGEKKYDLPGDILSDINSILNEFDMTLDKPMKQDYLNVFKQLVQFDHKNFRIEYIEDGKIGYLTENDNGDSLVQKINPQKQKVQQMIEVVRKEEQRREYELKRKQQEEEERQKQVYDKAQREQKLKELLECNLQATDLTPISQNERYEEMPELNGDLIKAFAQNEHIEDVRDLVHLNVIFQNLGIRNNEYTIQFLDVPVKLFAKFGQGKKRVYWKKRIGYINYDEKLKRSIFSPFPAGWPDDETKLKIQLKFDELRKDDVDQFINLEPNSKESSSRNQIQKNNGKITDLSQQLMNEKFQEMEEVCSSLNMNEKGDQIIFKDTLYKIFITNPNPSAKDLYQRCRKLMSKKVIYQNSQHQISFPPGYPQVEEFDKIEKEIPHFTQQEFQQYLARTLNRKDIQLIIQTILKRLNISNGDEENLFKDILLDGLFSFNQKNYKMFKNLKDKKLFYRTKKNEILDLPLEYKGLIRKIQEKFEASKIKDNQMAIDRIQMMYNSKFEIACLDTELSKLTSRKFKIEIHKCKNPANLYFGVINKVTIPGKKEFSKKNKLPDGLYLTNGKCDEMVGYLDEANYENFKKRPENRARSFGFEKGDIIHMTVNLFQNQIEYYNYTKQTQYKQKIYLEDFTFIPSIIMIESTDQITMEPLYDYPLQFALIWEDRDIYFNFQMKCPCNNQLDNTTNFYCTSCNTTIDRIHKQDDESNLPPITHCYFSEVPRMDCIDDSNCKSCQDTDKCSKCAENYSLSNYQCVQQIQEDSDQDQDGENDSQDTLEKITDNFYFQIFDYVYTALGVEASAIVLLITGIGFVLLILLAILCCCGCCRSKKKDKKVSSDYEKQVIEQEKQDKQKRRQIQKQKQMENAKKQEMILANNLRKKLGLQPIQEEEKNKDDQNKIQQSQINEKQQEKINILQNGENGNQLQYTQINCSQQNFLETSNNHLLTEQKISNIEQQSPIKKGSQSPIKDLIDIDSNANLKIINSPQKIGIQQTLQQKEEKMQTDKMQKNQDSKKLQENQSNQDVLQKSPKTLQQHLHSERKDESKNNNILQNKQKEQNQIKQEKQKINKNQQQDIQLLQQEKSQKKSEESQFIQQEEQENNLDNTNENKQKLQTQSLKQDRVLRNSQKNSQKSLKKEESQKVLVNLNQQQQQQNEQQLKVKQNPQNVKNNFMQEDQKLYESPFKKENNILQINSVLNRKIQQEDKKLLEKGENENENENSNKQLLSPQKKKKNEEKIEILTKQHQNNQQQQNISQDQNKIVNENEQIEEQDKNMTKKYFNKNDYPSLEQIETIQLTDQQKLQYLDIMQNKNDEDITQLDNNFMDFLRNKILIKNKIESQKRFISQKKEQNQNVEYQQNQNEKKNNDIIEQENEQKNQNLTLQEEKQDNQQIQEKNQNNIIQNQEELQQVQEDFNKIKNNDDNLQINNNEHFSFENQNKVTKQNQEQQTKNKQNFMIEENQVQQNKEKNEPDQKLLTQKQKQDIETQLQDDLGVIDNDLQEQSIKESKTIQENQEFSIENVQESNQNQNQSNPVQKSDNKEKQEQKQKKQRRQERQQKLKNNENQFKKQQNDIIVNNENKNQNLQNIINVQSLDQNQQKLLQKEQKEDTIINQEQQLLTSNQIVDINKQYQFQNENKVVDKNQIQNKNIQQEQLKIGQSNQSDEKELVIKDQQNKESTIEAIQQKQQISLKLENNKMNSDQQNTTINENQENQNEEKIEQQIKQENNELIQKKEQIQNADIQNIQQQNQVANNINNKNNSDIKQINILDNQNDDLDDIMINDKI